MIEAVEGRLAAADEIGIGGTALHEQHAQRLRVGQGQQREPIGLTNADRLKRASVRSPAGASAPSATIPAAAARTSSSEATGLR